jgi:hypothetical protein
MTDKPDFRELAGGDDLSPEESARLERVHELLVTAGPPPELPPNLAEPGLVPERDSVVAFLPRRRTGFMLGIAAVVALVAFVGGFLAGHTDKSFPARIAVPMHGTAQFANARATIHIANPDSSGNWPLQVSVKGLKPLPRGQYYEMFLTRHGKRAATCGTFRISTGKSVRLNAPYDLRSFTGWVVTLERPGSNTHPVVLTTTKI